MFQACMAGIVFAKFTKPTNRAETILFSTNALITLRNGSYYLSCRIGDMRRVQNIKTRTVTVLVTCSDLNWYVLSLKMFSTARCRIHLSTLFSLRCSIVVSHLKIPSPSQTVKLESWWWIKAPHFHQLLGPYNRSFICHLSWILNTQNLIRGFQYSVSQIAFVWLYLELNVHNPVPGRPISSSLTCPVCSSGGRQQTRARWDITMMWQMSRSEKRYWHQELCQQRRGVTSDNYQDTRPCQRKYGNPILKLFFLNIYKPSFLQKRNFETLIKERGSISIHSLSSAVFSA